MDRYALVTGFAVGVSAHADIDFMPRRGGQAGINRSSGQVFAREPGMASVP